MGICASNSTSPPYQQRYPQQGYPQQQQGYAQQQQQQGYPQQASYQQQQPQYAAQPHGYPQQGAYAQQGYPAQGYQQQPPPQQYAPGPPPGAAGGGAFVAPTSAPLPPKYTSHLQPFNYSRTLASQQGREVEKEPMLLLDVTGSMNLPTSEGAGPSVPRHETIQEAIGSIVQVLAAEDSQAEHEQGEEEEGGGLRTVLFAAGNAMDIGDLNPGNLRDKWRRIEWGGGTYIVPGWEKLLRTYHEEFDRKAADERPILLALIITDGDAEDTDTFAAMIADPQPDLFVCIAVIGFGQEHQRALHLYNQIAAANDHVRVVPFDSETDPSVISRSLLTMMG